MAGGGPYGGAAPGTAHAGRHHGPQARTTGRGWPAPLRRRRCAHRPHQPGNGRQGSGHVGYLVPALIGVNLGMRRPLYKFAIDPDLLAAIRDVKVKTGIPEAEQIRRALRRWLKEREKERDRER